MADGIGPVILVSWPGQIKLYVCDACWSDMVIVEMRMMIMMIGGGSRVASELVGQAWHEDCNGNLLWQHVLLFVAGASCVKAGRKSWRGVVGTANVK